MQLASETLVLREQLMRNKLDSRTVGSALLAIQEELKAAFNREQACEEGYNALLADLDSCRVNQERIGRPPPDWDYYSCEDGCCFGNAVAGARFQSMHMCVS